jgi:uncharacterized protein YjlB
LLASRAQAFQGGPEFESHHYHWHTHIMVRVIRNFAFTVLLTHGQAAQQSQGIQTLLEAEKDAAKVVQEARQCA